MGAVVPSWKLHAIALTHTSEVRRRENDGAVMPISKINSSQLIPGPTAALITPAQYPQADGTSPESLPAPRKSRSQSDTSVQHTAVQLDLLLKRQSKRNLEAQEVPQPKKMRPNVGGASLATGTLAPDTSTSRSDAPLISRGMASTFSRRQLQRRATISGEKAPTGQQPSLAELIGEQRAGQLDHDCGSLEYPISRKGSPLKPHEKNPDGSAVKHPHRIFIPDKAGQFPDIRTLIDLDGMKEGKKHYVWAFSKLGRMIVAEESCVGTEAKNGKVVELLLGHPTLVIGGRARMAGEIKWDASVEKFIINNHSGRYSRQYPDRDTRHVEHAAKLLRNCGLEVEVVYRVK